MPKIRFNYEADVHVTVASGDVLSVAAITPQIARLLSATRLDGVLLAEIDDGPVEETADLDLGALERPTLHRGRIRGTATAK